MTQLFLNPLTKFTSDNITALPGARLYFYQNNSSTPKAVYADKAKVTSLGVYVEADSAGIFEPIWLDGTYRAELKYSPNWNTTPGVTQTGWPIDDVGDIGNFAAFAAWDSTFTYDITTNTFVTGPNGLYYKSIQNPNLNKNPVSNPDYWEQIFVLSAWNENRSYDAEDIVVWEGKMYSSIAGSNLNHEPPNITYWNDLTFNNNIIGDLNVDGDIDVEDIVAFTVKLGNSEIVNPLILDWYQEGTFTPAIGGTASAGSGTYSIQYGKYTRIGNVVHVFGRIAWSAHTGSGNTVIRFLPTQVLSSLTIGQVIGSSFDFGGTAYSPYIEFTFSTSEAKVKRFLLDGSGASSEVPLDTAGEISFSGTYFTTT